jgi:hypothetical protein
MIIKGSQIINTYLDCDGLIVLEQYSTEFGVKVTISITPEQFNAIENWVFKNRDEIKLTWNEGVSDE